MIRNKKKVECNYCNCIFERPPSLIGDLNFCCRDHYHLFNKGDRKITLQCELCGEEIKQYKCYSDRRQFCCEEHKNKWIQDNSHEWTCVYCGEIFNKTLIRHQQLLFCCDEHRLLWKSNNGLKKLKIPCRNCQSELILWEKYLAVDNFCNRKCQREHMERIGKWIPIHLKSDWQIYNDQSNWIHSMYPFLSNIEKKLLLEKGFFNSKLNKNGLVRDHIFSRRLGFDFKIFPEIIRHPANCRLIPSKENISRHFKPVLSENFLTYEYLFNKIKKWEIEWKEHDQCLDLIGKYNTGEKWRRDDNE